MILANVKTPNVYTDININTQRTGLLPNHQRVLFITDDVIQEHARINPEVKEEIPHEFVQSQTLEAHVNGHQTVIPNRRLNSDLIQDIYDTQSADQTFGKNSVAGRMMKAAVKTNRLVNVQAVGESHFSAQPPLVEESFEIAPPVAM